MTRNNIKIEVCVDSVKSAIAAQNGGAYRVELCDNLIEGGSTPSYGKIQAVRENLRIKLNVIIRPRGGDFLYSDDEYEIIKKNIKMVKDLKADGIVTGFLNSDGSINICRTREIVNMALPLSVTFHRAFDMCRDPFKGMEDIINCGAGRLLTSGQKNNAAEGTALLAELQNKSAGRIIIMPGSGINEDNILDIHKIVRASEYHVSLRDKTESGMIFRKNGIQIGGAGSPDEYELSFTDSERVKMLIKKIT